MVWVLCCSDHCCQFLHYSSQGVDIKAGLKFSFVFFVITSVCSFIWIFFYLSWSFQGAVDSHCYWCQWVRAGCFLRASHLVTPHPSKMGKQALQRAPAHAPALPAVLLLRRRVTKLHIQTVACLNIPTKSPKTSKKFVDKSQIRWKWTRLGQWPFKVLKKTPKPQTPQFGHPSLAILTAIPLVLCFHL